MATLRLSEPCLLHSLSEMKMCVKRNGGWLADILAETASHMNQVLGTHIPRVPAGAPSSRRLFRLQAIHDIICG